MSRRAVAQPTLFDPPAPVRRAPDPAFIRRNLMELLYLVRTAEILPWSVPQTLTWEKLFRECAPLVPDGAELLAEWERELARVRANAL